MKPGMLSGFCEGRKTEVSILLLPYILVPPPKRGMKAARLGRDAVVKLFFMDFSQVKKDFENICSVSGVNCQHGHV
jgi:hypothetical protein